MIAGQAHQSPLARKKAETSERRVRVELQARNCLTLLGLAAALRYESAS